MALTSAKLDLLVKQAENQGKSVEISSNGNQYIVKYCSDSQFVRTNNGLVAINSIDGYKFIDYSSDHQDSDFTDTSAYDDMTLLGGFCGEPYRRTDYSQSEKNRQDLAAAISGSSADRKSFRERRDQQLKTRQDSSTVVTLPAITLDSSQKQQVKSMIEAGEDGRSIELTFGRIDSADLREICDELQLSSTDRILRFLA